MSMDLWLVALSFDCVGYLCPKLFNKSWMLVACGSVLKDLDATVPSKSERDWLEEKTETLQVRD